MLIHVKELPFSKTEQTTPCTVINQPKAPYLRLLPTTYNPTQKNRSREESELARTALNFEIARLILAIKPRKNQAKLDRLRLEEQERDRKRAEEQAKLKTMHESLKLLQQKNPEKYCWLEKQAADALGLNPKRLKSVIGGGLKLRHKMFELMELQTEK